MWQGRRKVAPRLGNELEPGRDGVHLGGVCVSLMPIMVDTETVTGRVSLCCEVCGGTDMGLITGMLSQGKVCCHQDMMSSEVPLGAVVVWDEALEDVFYERGLVAVRQSMDSNLYLVYRDGKECGRFIDRESNPFPKECMVTMVVSNSRSAEVSFKLEGLVIVRSEECRGDGP